MVPISVVSMSNEVQVLRRSSTPRSCSGGLDLPWGHFSIGPPIEDSFYHFDLPNGQTLLDEDLEQISSKMKEIVNRKQPFIRSEVDRAEAANYLLLIPTNLRFLTTRQTHIGARRWGDYPIETLTSSLILQGSACSRHRVSGSFSTDAGRGGILEAMRIVRCCKGSTARRATKKDLKLHLERLEEAAKRDHRKLATELDLLSFPSELGGGLAVWHPKVQSFANSWRTTAGSVMRKAARVHLHTSPRKRTSFSTSGTSTSTPTDVSRWKWITDLHRNQ